MILRTLHHMGIGLAIYLCAVAGYLAAFSCTPTDRATLARTALDSADRGCRAYLELRRDGPGEGDAGAEGGP